MRRVILYKVISGHLAHTRRDLKNHQGTHYIEIIASDSGYAVRLLARYTLTIVVSGEQTTVEAATTTSISFSQTEYRLSLQEGSPLGSELTKVIGFI